MRKILTEIFLLENHFRDQKEIQRFCLILFGTLSSYGINYIEMLELMSFFWKLSIWISVKKDGLKLIVVTFKGFLL